MRIAPDPGLCEIEKLPRGWSNFGARLTRDPDAAGCERLLSDIDFRYLRRLTCTTEFEG
jgi:hypothetical protein